MSQGRRGSTIASSQFHDGQPGRELRERESMEAKRRAFLKRNRAREIVHRTARSAKKKYLRAGLELLEKSPRFTQANRRRSRLKSGDNSIFIVRHMEPDSLIAELAII